jgi:hypothetical protein
MSNSDSNENNFMSANLCTQLNRAGKFEEALFQSGF